MFAVTANPNDTSDQTLINLSFYPDIAVAAFRTAIRAQDTITDQRVIEVLQTALIDVNDELAEWQATQELAGYTKIDEVPAKMYGPLSELTHLYKTAVYSKAKAQLMENYTDADNTDTGDDRAESMDNSKDAYLREAREAIRKIIGVPRVTVELI
ncbi:MAG: head completion/stabilization protein [Candidatus Pacearchaeota archaeon]|nr:head completion/stabilization protein [Candidatus Pacearchaeota archaeon]